MNFVSKWIPRAILASAVIVAVGTLVVACGDSTSPTGLQAAPGLMNKSAVPASSVMTTGKGPKSAATCASPRIVICHMDKSGLFNPVCVDTIRQHIPVHNRDRVADADRDGYTFEGACAGSANDCNDSDPTVHPGADDSNCNGVDEDCDGTADEDYVATQTTCGVGACASNTGSLVCSGGATTDTCDPFAGAAADDSSCDGADEDCDGTADEDYVATQTTCGVGACASNTGSLACSGGATTDTCDPFAGATSEADGCSDVVDNDCDGLTDGADTVDCL